MKIHKIPWLGHFDDRGHRLSIFSVHVHPDGSRIATGGLDGTVRIWSTEAIRLADGNEELKVHKQLCCMSTHTGTVTSVRFSANGQYLASGSDDRVVIIWHKEDIIPGIGPTFGSSETHTENWRSYRRLLGHDNDIQDICWSYDSQLFVSVGLDSSIIVWNGTTFERLKRIEAHQSHVKGITFDPAGKYFATESDDRTIKVWRVSDFALEKTISEPFNNSPLSTYFRRPSWSPDGKHIAASNAMNGPVACVSIIERGTWTSEINLIGHEGPVEVTSFNPKLFKDSNDKLVCILACGGQDRSLSIWSSATSRPMLNCQNICQKSIGDVCWSPDGLNLYLCSYDGTLLVCTFEADEFGQMVSDEEIAKTLAKYGHGRHGIVLPESSKQLSLEESAENAKSLSNKNKLESNPLLSEMPSTPLRGSEVTKPASPSINVETLPKVSNQSPKKTPVNDTAAVETPGKNTQKVTITKDGRKRVAPQLLTTLQAAPSTSRLPSTQLQQSSAPQLPPQQFSQPVNSIPKGGVPILVVGSKQKPSEDPNTGEFIGVEESNLPNIDTFQNFLPNAIERSTVIPTGELKVPSLKSAVITSIDNLSRYTLEVKNGSSEKNPTRIVVLENGTTRWMDYLPRPVLLSTGSIHFWAVACDDASLHIYSLTGSRLLPPVMIESKPVFLECNNNFLFCICSNGMTHAWDIPNKKSLFSSCSLAPILDSATQLQSEEPYIVPHVTTANISREGIPSVSLSTGQTYVYSSFMLSWQRVSDPWWAFGSKHWDSNGIENRDRPLRFYEQQTNEALMEIGRGKFLHKMVEDFTNEEGYEDFERIMTINHLENRIAAARLLHLNDEFLETSESYCKLLMQSGCWQKLEEFLDEVYADTESTDLLSGKELVARILIALRQLVQTDAEFERVNKTIQKYPTYSLL
ncbi:hira protein [Schizosaccharomyces cryophilus OY26]|uniref:Protein HIR n=1 Tax=Schizosaccharomyces cryophilus (strain OY26 / ATCC MYA-4695 / CBS 11777 / NBRC 106824 / NRRL Y48691) TaxID=653667 RepID=S9W544_SCHCR|nr:hira protein [Schizosaccharomyces cryophilus OY26]EPY53664.1 hira protein [Schizosaccharomyces cryophilus OY26]